MLLTQWLFSIHNYFQEVLPIKNQLVYLAISACLSIILSRYAFHPLVILVTIIYLFYLYVNFNFRFLLIAFIFIAFYAGHYVLTDLHNKTKLSKGEFESYFSFEEIPLIDGNRMRGTIQDVSGEKLIFSYIIRSYEEKEVLMELIPGDTCRFQGELKEPKSPTMPNAFNYKQYLHDHHIHWQLQVRSIKHCRSDKKTLLEWVLQFRVKGLTLIEENFPSTSEGIVQALLFGERSLLDEDVEIAYQKLGIVHLLAISGLHVGLLVGAIYSIMIYFGVTHEKTRLILIIILPIYMILTGASPSVVRASFMVILYFLIKSSKAKFTPTDVISFTCLVLLFINPYYLFQVGFQLSYIVTLGLLLSSKIIGSYTHSVVKLIVVSSVAQLCSIPLILFHFFEVSLISLPLNMIFVPFYSLIILPLSISSTLIVTITPPLGAPLISLLHLLLDFSSSFVLKVSSWSLTTITTGKPSFLFIMFYCISTLVLLQRFEKSPSHKSLYKPFSIIVILFLIQLHLPYFTPFGKVIIINVGQGDSIFINLPFNKGNFMIDTGGRVSYPTEEWEETRNTFSIAEDITVPYLKSIGVTHLDGLILSHGDQDHIGEAISLMNHIKVKELVIPKGFVRGELEERVIEKARKGDMKIRAVNAGDQLTYRDFSFYVLSPKELSTSKNDDSMVLWAKIGGLKWLFTGDAEMRSEERMVSTYPHLKVDVLKVGHHGSRGSTSEQLLEHIKPSIAIISAGYQNRYQHPHKEVIDKLEKRKIKILRTDIQGGILYKFKGNAGTFFTHPPYDIVK